MSEKFYHNNRAESAKRWFKDVNLSSADILLIEREIVEALVKARNTPRWYPTPIAPLAEPVSLDALVGDQFRGAHAEMEYQIRRVDNLYEELKNTNNVVKAELDTVEKYITQAGDDINDISLIVGDQAKQFYWVSDSFNNSTFVDKAKSNVLIDTDYGMALLEPSTIAVIEDVEIKVDTVETVGIPGCNLLVIDVGKLGTVTKEPEPVLETENTKDLAGMLDNDPVTFFEVERNFIPPKQKAIRRGRAFKFDATGKEIDVLKETKDYDWKVTIQWPNSNIVDAGPDGKGIRLAEFRDINSNTGGISAALGLTNNTSIIRTINLPFGLKKEEKLTETPRFTTEHDNAVLVFDLVLLQPQEISSIKILPFIRGANPINLKSITAYVGDTPIPIAADVELGATTRSTSLLQKEILRRTGASTTGSIFFIPTDQPITRFRIELFSTPEEAKYGLAHPFREDYVERRSVRKYVVFSSVDKKKSWSRKPVYEDARQIVSSANSPKLFGSVAQSLGLLSLLSQLFSTGQGKGTNAGQAIGGAIGGAMGGAVGGLGKIAQTAGNIGAIGSAINAGTKALGGLGSIGSFLGKAVPVIGGILTAVDLGKELFGFSRTFKTLDKKSGHDIFKGYRAGVALKDVTLQKIVYSGSSTLVSTKRSFPGKVTKIGLFVEEQIPTAWGPGDWISYYLSTDGTNWTSVPKITDVTLEKSYNLSEASSDIYFMAVMKGNPEDPFHSPVIKHYVLQGLPV